MIFAAVASIALGIAAYLYFGAYIPIPPYWVSLAHAFNFTHISVCVLAMWLNRPELLKRRLNSHKRAVAELNHHAIACVAVGIISFFAFAFFEFFNFGVVFALFAFPVIRLTYVILILVDDL